jgi:hypothetical protein
MFNLFGKKPTVEGTFLRLCYVLSLHVDVLFKETAGKLTYSNFFVI